MLCDSRDTSILIVDTYVTIPVSPSWSRYIAVYRGIKKHRETAQVSRVSTIPHGSYHCKTTAYDAKTNVIKALTVCLKHCANRIHSVTKYYYSAATHLWVLFVVYCYQGRTDFSRTKTRTRSQILKDFCQLEMYKHVQNDINFQTLSLSINCHCQWNIRLQGWGLMLLSSLLPMHASTAQCCCMNTGNSLALNTRSTDAEVAVSLEYKRLFSNSSRKSPNSFFCPTGSQWVPWLLQRDSSAS